MRNRIDLNDAVVSPFFVIASAVSAGLLSFSLFGYDFATPVFTLGEGAGAIGFSISKMVALGALGVALATNKPSISKMSGVEYWVTIATIGLILVPPFAPTIMTFIQTNTIAGLVTVIVQAGGYYSLSYLG